MEVEEHLFRRESGRLVAALIRIFGVHNLALAEDVVQDAFCRALEIWKIRGVPDNPSAWLMAAAKNRALDVVRRERTARTLGPDLSRALESEWTLGGTVAEAFAHSTIRDEQLRMMFSCCHPRLQEDVQVALILNILCGFGAGEIAGAFLTSRSAMEKRIARGKRVLAKSRSLFDLADREFAPRLSSVRRALYLLFSEGYHGGSPEAAVQADLCTEAIRLTTLLLEAKGADQPETFALAALMCLQAARLPARIDAGGNLSPLADQDRSRWDTRLIQQGLDYLDRSAAGPHLTAYHIEAAIASSHVTSPSVEATDWAGIVVLYDRLMDIAASPVVALNRAIAIGQCDGPARGLEALAAIGDQERLKAYPFYPAAMAELELRLGHTREARALFGRAASLARNPSERRFLEERVKKATSAGESR